MNDILMGILAIVAGFAATFALSYGMDALLRSMKVMGKDLPQTGNTGLVVSVLAYRTIFNVVGCYVAAILAPANPMAFALGLGALGFLASLGGALAANNPKMAKGAAMGPAYYSWGLVVLALPAAYIGGLLGSY